MVCFVFRRVLIMVVMCAIVLCQKLKNRTIPFRMVVMQKMADQERQLA